MTNQTSQTDRITMMRIGFINDDASTIYNRVYDLMAEVDEFKSKHGDFGEKVPRIYMLLEEAVDFVEDAIAEIELVRDSVTEGDLQ